MRNPTVDPAPTGAGEGAEPAGTAGGRRPGRLTRRAEFLHVGKGRRWHGKALTLQMAPRRATSEAAPASEPGGAPAEGPRFGFTLTKKVGCAVVRNRARRRLREALRLSPDLSARPGHDYVVVGRLDAIRLPFDALRRELARAVDAVHGGGSGGAPPRPPRGPSGRDGQGGGRARERRRRATPTGPERIWPNP